MRLLQVGGGVVVRTAEIVVGVGVIVVVGTPGGIAIPQLRIIEVDGLDLGPLAAAAVPIEADAVVALVAALDALGAAGALFGALDLAGLARPAGRLACQQRTINQHVARTSTRCDCGSLARGHRACGAEAWLLPHVRRLVGGGGWQ